MWKQFGRRLADDAVAFVLAGGRGTRLRELTASCAKPAVPFGGRSRIIDFALSNAVNSGIRRIAVATQYKQESLIPHLSRAARLLGPDRTESIDVLPGWEGPGSGERYRGTADAVFQNIDTIARHAPRYVVVLAGDHIYKMDYERMLRQHVDSGADATIGCIVVPRKDASGFGVMQVDDADRIIAFVEKPKDPPELPEDPGHALASMGIYVFDTGFLVEELRRDAASATSTHDFGGDVIPHVVRHGKAVAHRFSRSCVRSPWEARDYWRDVGTLDAYFEASLDVVGHIPRIDMRDPDWPIWTDRPNTAFALIDEGSRSGGRSFQSLADGGAISGAKVERSLLFGGVEVGRRSSVEDAVLLPTCRIGPGARLRRVIVESHATIPAGLVVGEDPASDARHFRRTEKGVCLITQAMLDRMGRPLAIRTAA